MIIDNLPLARPYADAIFEIAVEENQLAQWSVFLNRLALITENQEVRRLLKNPSAALTTVVDFYLGICDFEISATQKNMLMVLFQNGRLDCLPAIALFFEEKKQSYEKKLKIEISTVYALSTEEKTQFQVVLGKRYNRQIELIENIDPTLIGGVVIRAGDRVIDASIKKQVDRLSQTLMN